MSFIRNYVIRLKVRSNVLAESQLVTSLQITWPHPLNEGKQGDQKYTKKICQIKKNNPKSCQVKKGYNIYSKAQVESPKHLQQTTFETLKYLQQTML
jgi:hypothetical protein